MKKYNVEIYNYKTGETSAVIGTNLTESQAEKRELLGLSRCNNNYGTRILEIN